MLVDMMELAPPLDVDGRTARLGAAAIPEDPKTEAVIPGLSVLEHLALGSLDSLRRGLGIDWKRARILATSRDSTTPCSPRRVPVLAAAITHWPSAPRR